MGKKGGLGGMFGGGMPDVSDAELEAMAQSGEMPQTGEMPDIKDLEKKLPKNMPGLPGLGNTGGFGNMPGLPGLPGKKK